ncbi:MAG: serine/threonine-protein kinase [Pseudomonadota bacterium]
MLAPTIVGLPNFEDRAKSSVGKLVANRYRLESLLGLGGMSAVFRANDLEGKAFALKILDPEQLASEAAQRFERESKLLLELSDPHLVATLAAGQDEAFGYYLVMPLLGGRDLNRVLEVHGALAPESAVRVALQAARGLSAAHRLGLVHGEVQPGKLLFDRDGSEVIVKVCDFGITKRLDSGGEDSQSAGGVQLGSPDYAAPEQFAECQSRSARGRLGTRRDALSYAVRGSHRFRTSNRSLTWCWPLAVRTCPRFKTAPPGSRLAWRACYTAR